jgi:methyl-accepting chemotaxis protein
MEILYSFVQNISKQNSQLISFLIPIIFRLYSNHKENSDIGNILSVFLTLSNESDTLALNANLLWQFFLADKTEIKTRILVALWTIFPKNPSSLTLPYALDYFNYLLSEDITKAELDVNKQLIQHIIKFSHQYFFEIRTNSKRTVIADLIIKNEEMNDPLLTYYAIEIYSNLTEVVKDNSHLKNLYELRTDIYRLLFMTEKQNFESFKSFISLKNMKVNMYLHFLMNALTNISSKIHDDENYSINKHIVKELIQYSEKLNDWHEQFIITIRSICVKDAKIFLLYEYRDYFENLKIKTDGNIKIILISLCDLIEGRNLENMDHKLVKNSENIEMLNANVQDTGSKVNLLQKTAQNQESEIKNFSKNLDSTNSKLINIDEKMDEQNKRINEIDDKTLLNVPLWAKEITPLLSEKWVMIAKLLNFTQKDLNSWQTQADPLMAVMQEWFTINKSSEATESLIKILREINEMKSVEIIESHLKNAADTIPNEDLIDQQLISSPPQIFMSFQSCLKDKAELLIKYLENENFSCWADFGQLGGGQQRNNRIDRGLRAAHAIICFVTSDYSKDETSLNQVNLAVTLNKPIIPLLLEKLSWPPVGSLGPILGGMFIFII